ncbi:MAG: radical SAM protein [Candidatus Ryanbacteria bacterium]|nr:radical SAM protein [Candidatus Ryanbacteria bacterium]
MRRWLVNDQLVAHELRKRFPRLPVRRVILINPPALSAQLFDIAAARKKRYSGFLPYGLTVLAALLRRSSFEVSILDLNFYVLAEIQRVSEIDIEATWRGELRRVLSSFDPDIVGVTCMFTMTHEAFTEVVREVQAHDLPVIIGGVHVTNDTERVLRELDGVVASTHEGDVSFPELLAFLNTASPDAKDLPRQIAMIVDGQYWSDSRRALPTSEDFSHVAALDLVEVERYSSVGSIGSFVSCLPPGTRGAVSLSNRGCRAQCTFCSVRFFNGPSVRSRTVRSIVDEIERLYSERGVTHITWLDDDLFYGDPVTLFNEIVRRDIRITWDASNGVIAAAMTPEIIAAAAESGCIGLFFGFESGNPQILREIKKPGTIEQYYRASELVHRYPHIFTRAFLMLGFPHETLEMMMQTMRFAIEMDLDWYNITLLQPLPSTPIYKSMLEEGLFEDQVNPSEVKFQVGPFGKQTQIERAERLSATSFAEAFDSLDPSAIPPRDRLNLIWFFINYQVNYARVERITHPDKIRIMRPFLADIADRVTENHALAQWAAARIAVHSGDWLDADCRFREVRRMLRESAYWRDKFEAFNLNHGLISIEHEV